MAQKNTASRESFGEEASSPKSLISIVDPSIAADYTKNRAGCIFQAEPPIEAKKSDLKSGTGQCIAEMVAAQRFNLTSGQAVRAIYGCITSGTAWRFFKLEGQTITIDLMDYPLPPPDQILGFFVWMVQHG